MWYDVLLIHTCKFVKCSDDVVNFKRNSDDREAAGCHDITEKQTSIACGAISVLCKRINNSRLRL